MEVNHGVMGNCGGRVGVLRGVWFSDVAFNGNTNQKVEPSFISDSRPTLPPRLQTIVCESVNPNPAPCTSRSNFMK